MKMIKSKKGISLQELPTVIMTLVMVGAIALGGFVTWSALAGSTTNGNASFFLANITQMALNMGNQLPVIGTIIGVGILIAIVIGAFMFARGKGAF